MDFTVGFIPRRAVAPEILDRDPIRFFALKIIFRFLVDLRGVCDQVGTAWVRRWEFLEFPSSDPVLWKHRWKNVAAARIASIPVFVSRELLILYCYLSDWFVDQILGHTTVSWHVN